MSQSSKRLVVSLRDQYEDQHQELLSLIHDRTKCNFSKFVDNSDLRGRSQHVSGKVRQPQTDWKQPDGNLVKFSKGKCKATHLGWHNSRSNCWEGGQQYPGLDQQKCSQQVQRSDLPLYLVLVRPHRNSVSNLGFPNKRKILTYWNVSHGECQDGWEGARRWGWSTWRGCKGCFFSALRRIKGCLLSTRRPDHRKGLLVDREDRGTLFPEVHSNRLTGTENVLELRKY